MAQEKFSQFTPKIASDLQLDPVELAHFFLVGHTEKSGAQDNVKFALSDILDAAGASTLYQSAESDAQTTPESIGGLDAGVSAATLKTKTFSEVLDMILFATIEPTASAPSYSFNTLAQSGLKEVGSSISMTISSVFSKGQITNGDGSLGPALVGDADTFEFAGPGISGTLTQNAEDPGAGSVNVIFDVVSGNQSWFSTVNYAIGTGAYQDSKGNNSTLLDAQRVAGSLVATSGSIKGIYPILYGSSSQNFLSTGAYGGLTKLLQEKGTKTISVNAANEYIYFAYPASYGDLASIRDGNGFDVTGSFQKVTTGVTSSGLSSNWSLSYNIYRTNAVTSVTGQNYQFTW